MGGVGSGRRSSAGKLAKTDEYRTLDVRLLARAGFLKPGKLSTIGWNIGGRPSGCISVKASEGTLDLDYRKRRGDEEWQQVRYSINLVTTACHMGGVRQWFECPIANCRRRVAILYGGETFVCRKCRNLAYPSQGISSWERAILKADRLRDRLGWRPGIFNRTAMTKPKGMHWRTFARLVHRYSVLAREGFTGLDESISSCPESARRKEP